MKDRTRLVGFAAAALFSAGLSGCSHDGDTSGATGGQTGSGTGGTATGGSTGTGGTGTGGAKGGSGGSGTGGTGTGGTGTGGANGGTGGSGTGGTGTGGATGGAAGAGTGGARGGSSGAGGGLAGASGTGGGTGGSGTSSCMDNMQNGSETGVDCGGSCGACPNYKINGPNTGDTVGSGCNGGPAFMCTRDMVFSPEFKVAEADDFASPTNPQFVYGVVGHDVDSGGLDTGGSNACCQCYQLVFTSPRDPVSGVVTPKPMIVQAFNTGAGGGKNFDIYMGAGGEGANTAGCSKQYTSYPTLGQPNNGGIRAQNVSQCSTSTELSSSSIATMSCQSAIASDCQMITASNAAVQSSTQVSCQETSQTQNLYHLNWNVMAKRIECPANLTRVTGCKLSSQGLPSADATAIDMASASGKGFSSGYTTTTMQDCCRPTCAYHGNVSGADSTYKQYYTCDGSGNPG
jgi:hypothetical protein